MAFRSVPSSCIIDPNVSIGYGSVSEADSVVVLGEHVHLRSGTVIYHHVFLGDFFQGGHFVLIREHTTIGAHVTIGTASVIEGHVKIGDFVKIESQCFIPTHVTIGSRVFLGPGVVLTNDRYPLRLRNTYKPEGVIIKDYVTIGAGAVICPGVVIGEGSFIAAGAVVTRNVPPNSLVKGVPGKNLPLPPKLCEKNTALSWYKYLEADNDKIN